MKMLPVFEYVVNLALLNSLT